MEPEDKIRGLVQAASFKASPEVDKALWTEISTAYGTLPANSGRTSLLRAILGTTPVRLAAVAVVLAAVVFWRPFDPAGKAYALSDAIAAINQARTIHVHTTLKKGKAYEQIYEYWYDLEQIREYTHHEGTFAKVADSPEPHGGPVTFEPYRGAVTTVWDGQYLMRMDHEKRTVRFARLLSWEQELRRRRMADLALNAALPDVLQYLRYYTKIGKDTIDGQLYDIWRREWRISFESEVRQRYDIWISPISGEIGRTRRWLHHAEAGWLLQSETDKIEINQEPPAGIFAIDPPDDYTQENSKATAGILRDDFLQAQNRQGCRLKVLPGFMLEDGSILAIWTVSGEADQSDPAKAHAHLTWGGPLPQAPLSLFGLLFVPGVHIYGSVAFEDENSPDMMIHAVGRHLVSTHKAGRVYHWALYVPRRVIKSETPETLNIVAVVRDLQNPAARTAGFLWCLPVSSERFAGDLAEAFRDLSDNSDAPASMDYESLLRLARNIRSDKRLYKDFAEETKRITDIPRPEPVEIVP
ncbi:MAG: hypothetical protein RBR19_00135 [Sedimentisphaerales bacterium]|jgi:hypothetical protein|nr:hypothetical protein [Sedimentisphaerales bacterium]NLT75245.1 hypothetical protein [Planctomycetota bacterium]